VNKKIKIISPSTSFEVIPNFSFEASKAFFEQHGFQMELSTDWMSQPNETATKVDALHEAFADPSTDIILCSFGGFRAINLVDELDYELIKQHAKPFFGFSDITVLLNAIHVKTGITTFYGSLFLSFLSPFQREFTLDYFRRCLNASAPFGLTFSSNIINYDDSDASSKRVNTPWVMQQGHAEGEVVGGQIPTFSLLQGTAYFPDLSQKILLLEMNELDGENALPVFQRLLKSLTLQKGFTQLQGLLIGAFHSNCKVTDQNLQITLSHVTAAYDFPIIANCNFGHILPIWSIPIGGKIKIHTQNQVKIEVSTCIASNT
jgi:muramoyltetrapeptide carboxypeptidase LdcA involved in peptidoglycan recycling